MKEKIKIKLFTNKYLLKKLRKEGKSESNKIEKILLFKKPKTYRLNKRFLNDETDRIDYNDNQSYNEIFKIFQRLKASLKDNLNIYNIKKNENDNFTKRYINYKKRNTKKELKEIEKRNYVFGNLLLSYYKKGLKIENKFFLKDVYRENSLLLKKKNGLNSYFDKEISMNGSKSQKYIKSTNFLKKLDEELKNLVKQIYLKREEEQSPGHQILSKSAGKNDKVDKHRRKMNK